ncbi:hypothetical protein SDC9_39585 [bioreactor metagenome]|uniref:DUF364 domain-containing protein n=1 Tax=bioreactor metagenome TaxID=1076179 RepID=A0A644VQ98_9ZZZZ|nr:DUF364 domain-containing protein [Methanocorpusculum sp.]
MNKNSIIEDLLADLPEKPVPVRSVCIGAHWTAVCSTHCGLAATIIGEDVRDHTTLVRDAGHLLEKSAQELAGYALSKNTLEAGIGIAAINSLLEVNEQNAAEINAADLLMEKGAGKTVALVGHFPFIQKLRERVGTLQVLEIHPAKDEYPKEAAGEIIPQADVVGITGSSLVNHTMDDLLDLCDPNAQVIILGPTTPLSPVMFDHGASVIAGSRVINETSVLAAVGQGASFRQISGVKLLAFKNPGKHRYSKEK